MDHPSFFRVISPTEIDVVREDIFYREKYNEIINYLKLMLTNDNESIMENYKGFIEPNGALLIQVNPGSDISDYFKLIAKNYYLDLIVLDYDNIEEKPEIFLDQFNLILEKILEENEPSESDDDEFNKISRIILINQIELSQNLFKDKELLKSFLKLYKKKSNFKENGNIIVWLTQNIHEVEKNSNLVFDLFDLFIRIPNLDKIERGAILREFSENNPKIVFDIDTVINYTSNWEVKDLKKLLKSGIFRHFLRSELNDESNEITDLIIKLIEAGEYLPIVSRTNKPLLDIQDKKINQNKVNRREKVNNIIENDLENYQNHIKRESISDFMLEQLYEDAASKNYTELLIITDKLLKNESLEENDRKILANYAFVLNESPKLAQINLEKAKKRIDQIKRAFGK
jgi:hypothetical protein